MSTLTEAVKARRKQAGLDAASVISRIVPEVAEEGVNQAVRHLTARKHEPIKSAQPLTEEQQNEVYRKSRGVTAPVTPAEIGVTGAANVGAAYLTPRLLNSLGSSALKSEAPTLGKATANMFGPHSVIPAALAAMSLNHLISPLSDPLYHSGRRGYWSSVGEGISGAADTLKERGQEARQRYGLAGIPLQMMHGILNPVAGVTYAGRSLRDMMQGKEGSDLSLRAESVIHAALQ